MTRPRNTQPCSTRPRSDGEAARSWRCRYSQRIGGGGMADDVPSVEVPLDPVQVLQARGREASADSQEQLDALRAVMSDEQVLDQFGIDLTQLDD